VAEHTSYLTIAALPTILGGAVTAHYDVAIWRPLSGGIWARVLVLFFGAFGAISLANVWAQAIPRPIASHGSRSVGRAQSAKATPAKARG